ncbi:MAG: glutamate racemase [Candidatus Omnitrophica bacterium]|nr:glutamate racemase [Candidatus Omnitrophota bacterium]
MKVAKDPIGVFDSGLGGLTIVKEIRRVLPQESIVYFGDLARLPYGIKSHKQIIQFSLQNTNFLLQHQIKTLIIACNSSSSAAYQVIKRKVSIPVIDVIEPATREAVKLTRTGRIGVIATQATVDTGAYEKKLTKLNPNLEVYSRSCPMFVPMVEEGWTEGSICEQIVKHYLEPIKQKKVDVLMLGCTHYPLLESLIRNFMGSKVRLVNSAQSTVEKLVESLNSQKLLAHPDQKPSFKVYVSDQPRNFIRVGEKFLGERLSYVKVVRHAE